MRLGILYKPESWNVIYRATAPADALAAKGHDVRVAVQDERYRFDHRPLFDCDVVHIYRRADPAVVACVDRLRDRGVAITWDNDDDIRLLPADAPVRARLTPLQVQQDFQSQVKMLRRADVVTTTSDHLAATYRRAGASVVRRIENYLCGEQYARPAGQRQGIVIGWVAADEHLADARALGVAATLRRVMERHPLVRVATAGIRLDLEPGRCEHHRSIPLLQLKEYIRQFDIAIAPLADIPMSYARSNVKIKEYAAAGVPWLASARGPYSGLGPKQGGMLVEDHEWEQALERLITSKLTRARLRHNAQAWAKTQAVDLHVDDWLSVFELACAAARRRSAGARGSTKVPQPGE